MKRRSIIVLAVLGLSLTPVTAALAEEAGPQAVAVEPVKDFGLIAKGEPISHAFEIRNEGKTTLELTNVRPACGCTVAQFDKTIAPGKVGTVRAKVDTSNFAGPISKSIAVFTNDTANPKLQLVIKADVKPYIGAEPGFARYIYVQGEPIRPITQTLWTQDGVDFKVVNVSTPFDFLTAKAREAKPEERKADQEGSQYVVDLHLNPHAPVGPLSKFLLIEVDHPKQKTLRIPISGFVRPRQHVTPQQVDFGEVETEVLPRMSKLAFTNFITAGIEVTKVETGHEAITGEVREIGTSDGHRFSLMITLEPGMPKGEFNGTVKLHITDEQNPVVEVPIKGRII